MPLTKEQVAAWLAAYLRAWETYDPDAIGGLFTEDATYEYHPFDEPVRGRLAIVASWLEPKLPKQLTLNYVGRPERASPSEGYAIAHQAQEAKIVQTALASKPDETRPAPSG